MFFPSIDDHSSLVIGRGDVFNHFSPRGSFANIYNATSGALINEPMPPDFVQHKQNAQYKGNEIYNGQQFLALLPLNTLPNGVVIGSDVVSFFRCYSTIRFISIILFYVTNLICNYRYLK